MATQKKGILTRSHPQWWRHFRRWKRTFWKGERQAVQRALQDVINGPNGDRQLAPPTRSCDQQHCYARTYESHGRRLRNWLRVVECFKHQCASLIRYVKLEAWSNTDEGKVDFVQAHNGLRQKEANRVAR